MNIRVAIVDDDESVCRSFARLLQAVGMVTVGYSSAEAFEADANRTNFDCLVLDIQLDGMSGIELQKRLVAEGFRVPIIIITAYDDPVVRNEAEKLGCAGFYLKTDSGNMIIAAIRTAAGRQRA